MIWKNKMLRESIIKACIAKFITSVSTRQRSVGGQMVTALAFYSDNPSSNPAEVHCKIVCQEQKQMTKKGQIFSTALKISAKEFVT